MPDSMFVDVRRIKGELFMFFNSNAKLFVGYLLTSLLIGGVVWCLDRRREGKKATVKGFVTYALNPNIYGHKSAWQDYGLFLLNGIFYFGIFAQYELSSTRIAGWMHRGLESVCGLLTSPAVTSVAGIFALSFVVALLFDFSTFIGHYLFHKLPPLWAFHKVHHSAEVMTPISVNRLHPVELFVNSLAFAICVGIGQGVFSYLAMQDVTGAKVRGIKSMFFLFFLTGVNLRHSHIWVSYPKWLSWVLLSPAQHQIHHSAAAKHYTKNLGLIFSFWDRIFGTLYVPKEREELQFGLTLKNPNPYTSLKELYFKPFQDCRSIVRNRLAKRKMGAAS